MYYRYYLGSVLEAIARGHGIDNNLEKLLPKTNNKRAWQLFCAGLIRMIAWRIDTNRIGEETYILNFANKLESGKITPWHILQATQFVRNMKISGSHNAAFKALELIIYEVESYELPLPYSNLSENNRREIIQLAVDGSITKRDSERNNAKLNHSFTGTPCVINYYGLMGRIMKKAIEASSLEVAMAA